MNKGYPFSSRNPETHYKNHKIWKPMALGPNGTPPKKKRNKEKVWGDGWGQDFKPDWCAG